ncbi:MAG: acetyltransferase [Candidatus Peregrinibacteria bacterium GW2011_GWE2_39_6]|nr:MAG: acetyltransferase [Candidatus Peregrinibacteria bacterium GW2011_GWF2_39_17]KKR26055.1 MAG: acetyltransferase [Candidatus Peregrinibacteria bacterium GW2011_GWE2_39_6]HCW32738.1 hypothetical protein [Candidatus Peregrinibacteria bacterium]
MNLTQKYISKEKGIIFVAEEKKEIIGCIIGSLSPFSLSEKIERYLKKRGYIRELIISRKARGQGLGKKLLLAIENYFREQKCQIIKLNCFGPDLKTHAFYTHLGYKNHIIEMEKKLPNLE